MSTSNDMPPYSNMTTENTILQPGKNDEGIVEENAMVNGKE
jgi:hypothetical protein